MNITFIKECPPRRASGWSHYYANDQATLPRGQQLIDEGFACEGWEPVAAIETKHDVDQLRAMAKEAGIKGYSRMKESTLLNRLGL